MNDAHLLNVQVHVPVLGAIIGGFTVTIFLPDVMFSFVAAFIPLVLILDC